MNITLWKCKGDQQGNCNKQCFYGRPIKPEANDCCLGHLADWQLCNTHKLIKVDVVENVIKERMVLTFQLKCMAEEKVVKAKESKDAISVSFWELTIKCHKRELEDLGMIYRALHGKPVDINEYMKELKEIS